MVLAHERLGAGPRPIVLLHGLLGSGRNLRTLARGLSDADEARSVVTLDLAGHGASPPLPPGADARTLAGDVLATLDALALAGPLAVVGHSLGGRVALRVAEQAPARVQAVALLDIAPGRLRGDGEVARVLDVLVGAPPSFPDRGAARAMLLGAGLAPALTDWLLLNLTPDGGGVRWRVDARALAALHARVAAEDLWPVVEARHAWRLGCVRGGASPFVDERDARRIEAAGGRVLTVDGAGHFLHAEQPAAVLDAVGMILD
jgi:esterase